MFNNITVSGAGLSRPETIAPPMSNAITIPVWVDGVEVIVYVCRSPFMPRVANEGNLVKRFAAAVAVAIEGIAE